MNKTTIRISKKLLEVLKRMGRKGETYEDIIWRLLEKCGEGND